MDLAFDGETPLFYAVRLRRFEVMAQFLAAGADPDTADTKGRTPLHLAAARRYPAEVVEALLAAGADPARLPGPKPPATWPARRPAESSRPFWGPSLGRLTSTAVITGLDPVIHGGGQAACNPE